MKTKLTIIMALFLFSVSGCWFGGTTESPQGGTVTGDEGFSIAVPTSSVVNQGSDKIVTLSLNRGAYFKRDVTLEIKAKGISVTPNEVLIRASDTSDVELKITAARDAAIGMYRVSVLGIPKTGETTSMEFTVEVIAQ